MAVRKLSPNASISLQIMEDIAPGGDVFAIVQPLAAPRRVAASDRSGGSRGCRHHRG